MVGAWLDKGTRLTDGRQPHRVVIRNNSPLPVQQAWLTIRNMRNPDLSYRTEIPILPPGDTEQPLPVSDLEDPAIASDVNSTDYRVSLAFTDASGTPWMRDSDGLTRLRDSEFIIWAEDHTAAALRQYADRMLRKYRVKVTYRVQRVEDLLRDFSTLSHDSPDTPDLIVGPHDWIADLVSSDSIEEIYLTDHQRRRFDEKAIAAMTYRGRLYGIPYAWDTVALLRNPDLAPERPKSVEDMKWFGRNLTDRHFTSEPFVMQVGATGDFYHLYPMLTSLGAWLFRRSTIQTGTSDWSGLIRRPR